MSTTSINLPPELNARAAALAKKTGRSAHSLIVESVERQTAAEEPMEQFVADALAADADIERTGEVYRTDDAHACLGRLATAKKAPRPTPWRRSSMRGGRLTGSCSDGRAPRYAPGRRVHFSLDLASKASPTDR